MSSENPGGKYKELGKRLKALRSRANESLAEASGAIEIDVLELASIELGEKCPSEDVLLLLISHYGTKDEEAVRLWEMAGYATARVSTTHMVSEPGTHDSQGLDDKILFTDLVDVVVNNYGVVMNFLQSAGPNASPVRVARVGMSREHAKSVMEILQATLSQIERHQEAVKKPSTDQQAPRADII